jgi:tetratricopeptide (TPR) repeat protein
MACVSEQNLLSPGVIIMTGNTQKQIFRFFAPVIAILLLCGINSLAAQEKVSPLSDFQYKKDFAQYDGIKKEADAQKRADLLLAYLKDRPISKLLLNAVNDYLECVKAQKDPVKASSMVEALIAVMPTDQTVKAAEIPVGAEEFVKEQLVPSQKAALSSLATAFIQAKNYPKAAETLEKIYAMAPDKALLPLLADVYKQFNADKYMEYAQKILAEIPIEQSYATALELAQELIRKNDIKGAIELYLKVLDIYGEKVPPTYQEPAWNAVRAYAYGLIASTVVYPTKDWPKIIEAYGKVLKFDPKREDAYYFIGMSKWQTKDQTGAIEAFAKCTVLSGPNYGAKAKTYMEQLYKAEHNGSLDGIDQVLAKAKSELGIK